MYWRSSVNVEKVKWRNSERNSSQPGEWRDTPNPFYRAGEPISVQLPASSTGELFVEIAAKDAGSGHWLKRRDHVIVGQKQKHEN